ncbi:efflux RND transporter periplasmic adaptor subunit [Vibrio tapetis subsp. quintayensis]|uniref:efflux RND transporter periplasmic adaptor subunit n=1 Tax=Vibrio tapetis TaxID=52443 RepID=UPI0025B4F1C7|nr:efflux RND transporter periplasmic adaptor subunit [Vibrio tapetis]MDN3680847.1 efflux RND transporter periplasmic adaptor subunit [Vibrio tapetis subsp. quintayensis]
MKRKLPIFIGFFIFALAVVTVIVIEPEPKLTKEPQDTLPPVTVQTVQLSNFSPTLSMLGTTSARWISELKAQSSAKIVWLNDELEPGSLIKKGQTLAKLETTHLESQVAQAHGLVKQAELQLRKEKHEQTVALKMLQGKNSSSYARKEPQIEAANATLDQAKTALLDAKKRLSEAHIRAPFDAIILARNISPAQYVDQGQALFKLASSKSLDVVVPVAEQQWQAISAALHTPSITVKDRQDKQWNASVRHLAPEVDQATRQRQVVLAIKQPFLSNPRLLPNQQVRVDVTLEDQENSLLISSSSITRDSQIWLVDEHDTLVKRNVNLLQRLDDDRVWVQLVTKSNIAGMPDQKDVIQDTYQVVMYPLLSMLQGIEVTPVYEGDDE